MTGYEEEQQPEDDYTGQPQEPDASDAVWNVSRADDSVETEEEFDVVDSDGNVVAHIAAEGALDIDGVVTPNEIRSKAFGIPFPLEGRRWFSVPTVDARVVGRGEHVETLLAAVGWQGDVFTPEFREEVRQIQAENNLPVTGRVDARTWDVIVNGK